MKIIYNNIIPFPGYKCINIFGILFARKGAVIDDVVINHESIHSKQMKELLWIFFYFLYVFEFIVYLVKLRDWHKAYKNISFEMEAYDNEEYLNYLLERKPYAWFKYW